MNLAIVDTCSKFFGGQTYIYIYLFIYFFLGGGSGQKETYNVLRDPNFFFRVVTKKIWGVGGGGL